jgi:hypothetical protein
VRSLADVAAARASAGLARPPRFTRAALACFALYATFQIAWPLRTHLYGGDVLWHEQGMRFSWRVMLREKNASVTYLVTNPSSGRSWEVPPRKYLTPWQEREFGTQPDLVLQLAHRVAAEESARLGHPVEVRADVVASLNGRRSARLVDPDRDLAKVADSLLPAAWIEPAPEASPPRRMALR